jgi:DNA polymerase-3 subunit delta'
MQSVIRLWYESSLQALLARKGKMPHALLLAGAGGIGKEQFATILSAALLCRQPAIDNTACGTCQSCRLLAANTHPDFYRIELLSNDDDKLAKEIKVDQIRELTQSLAQTSQLGGRKIAVIDPADKMNRNSANSLLKTLEEPASDTLLLLLTTHPSRLLPTVRSRCQKLILKTPPRDVVINWLQQQYPQYNAEALYAAADGAPFAARALAESDYLGVRNNLFAGFCTVAQGLSDPVMLAGQWAKCEPELVFRWVKSWILDLIDLASGGSGHSGLQNVDLQKDLHALVSRIDLHKLFYFHDQLQSSELLAQGSANMQLLYESLLLEWSAQCAIKP